jgi:hypothetical protein
MTLIYVFAFRWKLGLSGMFCAKICLEWCIITAYLLIIHFSDWDKISEEAQKRSIKDSKKYDDNDFENMDQ